MIRNCWKFWVLPATHILTIMPGIVPWFFLRFKQGVRIRKRLMTVNRDLSTVAREALA